MKPAPDGRSGAFVAGTEDDATQIAREIVGTDPDTLEARYEARMQHAGEAARDYRRRKLLGLEPVQFAIAFIASTVLAGCASTIGTTDEQPKEPIAVVTAPPDGGVESDEADTSPPPAVTKPSKSKARRASSRFD